MTLTSRIYLLVIAIGIWSWGTMPAYATSIIHAPPAVSGVDTSKHDQVTSADVLARVKLLQGELDLLRTDLDKPKIQRLVFTVANASQRENFLQAFVSFQKANNLGFEFTGTLGKIPTIPHGKVNAGDVWHVVNKTLDRVLLVKRKLGIIAQVREQQQAQDTTSTQTFNAMLPVDRQLNNLLKQPLGPTEVFKQVALAEGYTKQILSRLQGHQVTIAQPAAPKGRRPYDAYQQLLACFKLVTEIAKTAPIHVLTIIPEDVPAKAVKSSDVYDVAAIVVSKMAELNSKMRSQTYYLQTQGVYPGRKSPAQVVQQIALLKVTLQDLQKYVATHPHWLQK